MSYKFNVIEGNDWYGIKKAGRKMFGDKDFIMFEPGITILVGCNGSGKTTTLHQLKNQIDTEDECMYIQYDNMVHGGREAIANLAFHEDFKGIATQMQSSEGENIYDNLSRFATKMGQSMTSFKRNSDKSKIFFLFDAADSGFSIDNIIEYKNFFHFLVDHECKKLNEDKEVYIIISTNAYEFTVGERCLDVTESEYISFENYEQYKKYILETKDKKKKRYKWD